MKDIQKLSALFIAYIFLCSGIYHYAFWSPFNIDIFQYLDISTFILSILKPLITTFFIGAFVFILSPMDYFELSNNKQEDSNSKSVFFIPVVILKLFYFLLLIYLVVFDQNQWKGQYAPFYFIPGIFLVVRFLIETFELKFNQKKIYLIISLLIVLPPVSYFSATLEAKNIYYNRNYSYSTYYLKNEKMKFLGKASNYFFFKSLDNKRTLVLSGKDTERIQLMHYSKSVD